MPQPEELGSLIAVILFEAVQQVGFFGSFACFEHCRLDRILYETVCPFEYQSFYPVGIECSCQQSNRGTIAVSVKYSVFNMTRIQHSDQFMRLIMQIIFGTFEDIKR